MSLRDRCGEMCSQMQRNAMLRQGSLVDDLIAFVLSETARRAEPALEDGKSLILYFSDEEGRAEFKALILEAKPGMVAKDIP